MGRVSLNGSKKSSAQTGQSGDTGEELQPSTRPSFALGTTATDLDPRVHAIRGDIADIALADRIALPHYVAPVMRQVCVSVTDLRCDPDDAAELGSQLLYGERFAWLDSVDDWAWGYGVHDHFVGFVRKDALAAVSEPTHIVSAVSTPVADGHAQTLPMGSLIAGDVAGDTVQLADGSIALSDVRPVGSNVGDPVAIAEMFAGAPYLLGGRSINGIDCSGLVQIALAMAGHAVQRDSDMQQESIGEPLSADTELQRGDLVFFPEHVGMMVNATDMIHATGHAGKVVTEPLADVTNRIAQEHETPVLARRRIAR